MLGTEIENEVVHLRTDFVSGTRLNRNKDASIIENRVAQPLTSTAFHSA